MSNRKQFLSIGEASRITGVHVKSLRYYDRIGVFVPEYVDEKSGYRYYSFEQLQKIIAIRTCLDTGIVLSDLKNYQSDNMTDYIHLISDARKNVEEQIRILEERKKYLDFVQTEVIFNDRQDSFGQTGKVYGTVALWAMPYDGDIDSFSRKDEFLRLAEEAEKNGFGINPLYFGMLMEYRGNEKKLFVFAGINNFLGLDEVEHEYIYRTPVGHYQRILRPDLDVSDAEQIFPELFAIDYDKVVLATVSLQSNTAEPMYSMFINLPE